MATAPGRPWTADEISRLPEGWRYEIDEGELVIMAPAGPEHGDLTARVVHVLTGFVYARRLGRVLAGEPGFYLRHAPEEILRAPDVAFLSEERFAGIGNRRGCTDVVPELAVEIHAAGELAMGRKVEQYLAAGVLSVWVIDPAARTLTQHRPGEEPILLADADDAVTDPLLPGFRCGLRDLLGGA